MLFVNKLLALSLITAVSSSLVLYSIRYVNSPLFLDGRGSALLFSHNYYFRHNGAVKHYTDYHTINYGIWTPKLSHTTRRVISEPGSKVVINYYLDFYDGLIDMYGIEFPQGLDLSGNPIGAEAHALNNLDHHHMQIMHSDNRLFCYFNLLTGSIKCARHMNSAID